MAAGHYSSREFFLYFVGDASESEAADMERHLAGCGQCVGRARREYRAVMALSQFSPRRPGPGPVPAPQHPSPPTPPSGASSSGIAATAAQVAGAVGLVFLSIGLVMPWIHQPRPPAEAPGPKSQLSSTVNPADWPFQADFKFRLKSRADTYSMTFPHHPSLSLSTDYQYSIILAARQPGWMLLFSVDQDQTLLLLSPESGSLAQIPYLGAGQTARFPSEPEWTPVTSAGKREFYAVYLSDLPSAQDLVRQYQRLNGASKPAATLIEKLDEMVVANGCASAGRSCALTFEYQAF